MCKPRIFISKVNNPTWINNYVEAFIDDCIHATMGKANHELCKGNTRTLIVV